MNGFFASLVLVSSGVAVADTATPKSKLPPATCDAKADIVLELEQKSVEPKHSPVYKLVLRKSGAWDYVEKLDGKLRRSGNGCVAVAQVSELEKAFAAASWKTKMAEVTCTAYATTYREYRFRGKLVASQRMCDGVIFEKSAEDALGRASTLMNPLIASMK